MNFLENKQKKNRDCIFVGTRPAQITTMTMTKAIIFNHLWKRWLKLWTRLLVSLRVVPDGLNSVLRLVPTEPAGASTRSQRPNWSLAEPTRKLVKRKEVQVLSMADTSMKGKEAQRVRVRIIYSFPVEMRVFNLTIRQTPGDRSF